MVTLQFDIAIFDGAATPTKFLELLRERDQFVLICLDACDDGYYFAAALLTITHHAYNTIAFLRCAASGMITQTLFIWLPTFGAGGYTSTIGRINNVIRHKMLPSRSL